MVTTVRQHILPRFVTPEDAELSLEIAGRTAYQSEDMITPDSAAKFIRNIIKRGHTSVLEHSSASFRIVCNRAIANELVRHRLASFTQESTRYVKYTKRLTVITNDAIVDNDDLLAEWVKAMRDAENHYKRLLELGAKPEDARDVLPLALKTELVMTANFREWLHVIGLRTAKGAHHQVRELIETVRETLEAYAPTIFAKKDAKP